ncbi:hypothetical protein EJ05DRAFT_508142 [Pseudovirgaria hyperparasitica]|uniref:Uncharacterized protein n=1 Tax=Pseudovirgaria hyperparasitica TaxID=470096 RepID=A0A6A6WFG9_9PEZI|nr:uncharacterized protein EJ05DRAFT_508142 [Pseudovirgaria hyperparasitica]KAF2760909.1 hypothetical protein EJ05DRAFT_508142 [Pseudovirgaria hyperparasitica]
MPSQPRTRYRNCIHTGKNVTGPIYLPLRSDKSNIYQCHLFSVNLRLSRATRIHNPKMKSSNIISLPDSSSSDLSNRSMNDPNVSQCSLYDVLRRVALHVECPQGNYQKQYILRGHKIYEITTPSVSYLSSFEQEQWKVVVSNFSTLSPFEPKYSHDDEILPFTSARPTHFSGSSDVLRAVICLRTQNFEVHYGVKDETGDDIFAVKRLLKDTKNTHRSKSAFEFELGILKRFSQARPSHDHIVTFLGIFEY